MPVRRVTFFILASLVLPLVSAAPAQAQIGKVLKRAAQNEVNSQLARLVREGVACVFHDLECIRSAQEAGDDVYLTDADGEPVVDEDGNPVTDPDEAATVLGQTPPGGSTARPGEGAWARWDFVPGDEVLLVADYANDAIGDFPRRFALVDGSFEVVEWQGDRYVRAISTGIFGIPLPETLPDRFTLETSVNLQHGNAYFRIVPGDESLDRLRDHKGSVVSTEWRQAGIRSHGQGPQTLTRHDQAMWDAVVPLRVMADGDYLKVYLGENRVANVPNAVFPRTDMLFVGVGSAAPERPILIGPIRIAAGGADLYDRIAADGRVATQGILFDVDSDRIRPESTPTLKEIGAMLQEHPDLRLSIEGHTDSDGDDAHNLDLSRRRAEAVREFLIDAYDIDGARLQAEGLGETAPAAPNTTPDGKQQNRRVELVRIG